MPCPPHIFFTPPSLQASEYVGPPPSTPCSLGAGFAPDGITFPSPLGRPVGGVPPLASPMGRPMGEPPLGTPKKSQGAIRTPNTYEPLACRAKMIPTALELGGSAARWLGSSAIGRFGDWPCGRFHSPAARTAEPPNRRTIDPPRRRTISRPAVAQMRALPLKMLALPMKTHCVT